MSGYTEVAESIQNEADLFSRMLEARKRGVTSEVEQLKSIYGRLKEGRESGSILLYDSRYITDTPIDDEKISAVFNTAKEYSLHAIEQLRLKTEANRPIHEMEVSTYKLMVDGTVEVDEIRSGYRNCLGGLCTMMGKSVKGQRVVIYVPRKCASSGIAEMFNIAVPNKDELELIKKEYNNNIAAWMEEKTYENLVGYARSQDMLIVDCEPSSQVYRKDEDHIMEIIVSLMDRDTVTELCTTPDGLGASKLYYMRALLSNCSASRGVVDYRLAPYISVNTDTMDSISQILGLGKWKGDGWSLFFPIFHTAQTIQNIELTMSGRMLDLDEAQQIADALNTRSSVEFQFRATEINDEQLSWLAKGTTVPADRHIAHLYVNKFESMLEEQTPELKKTLIAQYGEGLDIIKKCLSATNDVYLFVQGDQIKVGSDRSSEGVAAIAGTYLTGAPDWNNQDSKRMQSTILGRFKPTQYNIGNNAQGIQFATNAVVPDLVRMISKQGFALADKLRTKKGISEIVWKGGGYEEMRAHELQMAMGYAVEHKTFDIGKKDLLRKALMSGAIHDTQKGIQAQLAGEEVPLGQVRMFHSIKSRLDSIVAAEFNSLIRTFGIKFYGYLNHRCEDSVSIAKKSWKLENVKIVDSEFEYFDELPSVILDNSTVLLPEKIGLLVNGDCDGDLIAGIAADVYIDGMLCKVAFLLRYPCVDAPVMWILQGGTPTPWDGRTTEESERFSDFITAFCPELPEGADVHGDEVIIAETKRMVRLSDFGAKESVKVAKIDGPVNMESGVKLVKRKEKYNTVGTLTRRQERFSVRLNTAIQRFQAAKTPKDKAYWAGVCTMWKWRAKRTSIQLEQLLSGFKKDTQLEKPLPLHMGQEDYRFWFSNKDVTDAIPLNHHWVIKNLRVGLNVFHRVGTGDTCLEHMTQMPVMSSNNLRGPITGEGKETDIANAVIIGRMVGDTMIGGAGKYLIEALNAIKTDTTPYLDIVNRHLETLEITPEHHVHMRQVLGAWEEWRVFWKTILAEAEVMRAQGTYATNDEYVLKADELVGHAGYAIKQKLRMVGDQVSIEGILLALQWELTPKEVNGDIKVSNAAAAIALIDQRLIEIFPVNNSTVITEKEDVNSISVFTRGVDFPGEIGHREDLGIYYDKDSDKFLCKLDNKIVEIVPAADQEKRPNPDDKCISVRVTNRSGIVVW